jgi:hypothetical protein
MSTDPPSFIAPSCFKQKAGGAPLPRCGDGLTIDGITGVRAALLALGAFFVLASAIPYVLNIVKGRTRPRMFSWLVWTLLGAIATGAAYTEGEHASAALTAAATVETASIVVLGWRYGNRNFERLDLCCLVGVTIGLTLWALLDSPLSGLVAALLIDILAAIPTVRHAWRRPTEEAAAAYLLCAIAAVCCLAAMSEYTLVGLLYPVYLLALNGLVAAIILRVVRPFEWFSVARRPAPDAVLTYGRHAAGIGTGLALTAAGTWRRRKRGRHTLGRTFHDHRAAPEWQFSSAP